MSTIQFHRPMRTFPEKLAQNELVIVAPPPPPPRKAGGGLMILQFLLPAMGGMTSIVFYLSSPSRSSPLLLIAVGGMLVASIGSGVLMRSLQARQTRQQAKQHRQKYGQYLVGITTRLDDVTQRQRTVAARFFPPVSDLAAIVTQRAALWERTPPDDDFLHIRIGTGITPLSTRVRVDIGANPLAEFEPELLTKAQTITSKYAHLDDAPITLALRDHTVVTVQGSAEQTRGLARAIVDQIATFHAPNDVRVAALFAPRNAREWAWLKWLPHTRLLRPIHPDDGVAGEPFALLADDTDDALRLLQTQFVGEIERRRKLKDVRTTAKPTSIKPHFLIICDDYSPRNAMARLAPLAEWQQGGSEIGVTLLCLVRDGADEPPTTQVRLTFDRGGTLAMSETGYGGHKQEFISPDSATVQQSEQLARQMTPLVLREEHGQAELAGDVRLLPLLGIATPADLLLAQTWQPRSRNTLLRVPLGLGADGEPLLLDIREAAEGGMGPHGMVIGATGSGKSELLRTIVTSLAITHDPETLNFILADFKGGASFAELAQLPHAAGLITNLQSDLSQVDRMRAALFGEQERRQRLLRTWGNLDNIRQYHQQRAQQPAMEPLPYLMIIVDEFAELLTQRPDFLELFVAIGRVGRSLGMHMLLATQRLGEGRIQGLEGHLRYRICLRTFSAAESTAVLGTPDAFYLPSFPGIGYVKVDTTIYKQFKSALVTVPVASIADTTAIPPLRAFSPTGKLHALHADAAPPERGTNQQTEMDAIIAQIHHQSSAALPVHQVWVPPLAAQLTLRQTFAQGGLPLPSEQTTDDAALRVPLGLMDLPAEQVQRPLILDFAGANGHLALVGAPLSGKSTTLQTLMMSLISTHSPRAVQIYGIDLGGGLLRAFEGSPHVGAICGAGERDAIRRLLRLMRSVIEAREVLFRVERLDGIATFRARRQAGELLDVPFGDVFLLIDNLGQLRSEIEDIDVEITELATMGLTYGVHIVVTANRWSDIRAKLRDTIGARLELRLNDPADSEMGKNAAQALLHMPPGRGIIKGGTQFQVALPSLARDGSTGRAAIDQVLAQSRARWPGSVAPPLRLLPAIVRLRDMPHVGGDQPSSIPIGIDEFQLATVSVDLPKMGPHFLIFGDGETGKSNLLRLWLHELTSRTTPEQSAIAVIDNRRSQLDVLDYPHLLAYSCTPPMLKDLIDKLRAAIEPRLLGNTALSLEEIRKPRGWAGPHYYLFIDDYESLITPSGNPLAPLNDLVVQGKEVGLHVILARRVAGTSRSSMDPIMQRLKELATPGLILGGDPQEGALLGTQRAGPLPTGRGYYVRRNARTLLVQTALFPTNTDQEGMQ